MAILDRGGRAHKPGRRTAKPFILVRAAFAKMSAVEGIRVTAAMEEEFREWDRTGLSAEKRRRIISTKCAKGQ